MAGMEEAGISTEPADTQKKIRTYANKFDLDEMDEFPQKYNLTDCKRKMKKKSNSKTIKEIASVSENLPTKYPPGCKGFNS